MVKELVDGGVDFIKEDEILSNPNFCKLEERVKVISKYLKNCGRNIVYSFCINGDHNKVLERAKLVAELGGNGVHINFWSGLGVYNAIRKLDLPIYIHFQKSGDKVITFGDHNFAIEWRVICLIASLLGMDSIHAGMIGGYLNDNEENMKNICKNLTSSDTIPALSCGLNSESIPQINKVIGTDYMANVGGAIHSNPDGSKAGALIMRNAIDHYE